MQNTYFIVIEGLDGSGKTEMSRQFAAVLQSRLGKEKVLRTYEPQNEMCAGDFLREALARRIRPVENWTLALAFAANRADHNTRVITPFLAQDHTIVICDRYYLSSLVYQSSPSRPFASIMDINASARTPDLILFLNASNEVCYQRMDKREKDQEMFEDKLAQLRGKYREAIGFLRGRGQMVVEINADEDMASVLQQMLDALVAHAPEWIKLW